MPSKAANRLSDELLADAGGLALDERGDGLAVDLGGQQGLGVGRLLLQRDVEQALGELDEVGVLGDEVGLAVELEQRAVLADDDAVGRGALEALADVLGALDAQELDGLVVVAVGLGEGLLAVHHAGAGGVAETLDVGCGELSHVTSSWSVVVRKVVRACRGAVPARHGTGTAPGDQAWAGVSPVRPARPGPPRRRRPRPRRPRRLGAGPRRPGGLGGRSGGGVATGQELALPVGQRLVATDDRLGAASPRPASACAAERAMRPSATASAMTRVSTVMLRIASSLPGIL